HGGLMMTGPKRLANVDVGERADAADRAAKLILDQLTLALRNLRPNHYLMPVFAAIIGIMFSRWVPLHRPGIWFRIGIGSVVPLGIVSRTFRHSDAGPSSAGLWVRRATAAYALFAAGWASMAIFLWAPHGDLNHLIIIMLIACTIAGNAALAGASKPL